MIYRFLMRRQPFDEQVIAKEKKGKKEKKSFFDWPCNFKKSELH